MQWLAYVGLASLLISAAAKGQDRRALLALALLAFAGEVWRVHVERGQVYVLYSLLLAISYRITRTGQQTLGGAVLGLLVGLRPTLLVTVFPFAMWRRWWFLLGTMIGLAAALLSSLILADMENWQSYFRAMDTISSASTDGLEARGLRPEAIPVIPESIEGWSNLASALRFAHPETGYARIVQFLGLPRSKLLLQLALLVYLVAFSVAAYRRWKSPVPLGATFLLGTAMAVSCELFLPVHRGGYSNVLWLVPAGILIAEVGVPNLCKSPTVWLLIVGLALSLGIIPAGRGDYISLSDTLLVSYFALVLLNPSWNRQAMTT